MPYLLFFVFAYKVLNFVQRPFHNWTKLNDKDIRFFVHSKSVLHLVRLARCQRISTNPVKVSINTFTFQLNNHQTHAWKLFVPFSLFKEPSNPRCIMWGSCSQCWIFKKFQGFKITILESNFPKSPCLLQSNYLKLP